MQLEVLAQADARFWSMVDSDLRHDGCWVWIGSRDKDGYGRLKVAGKLVKAHRMAFALGNRRWPDGMVCHQCDNPSCVRPSHLWEGTNQQNQQDAVAKGRKSKVAMPGQDNPNAKLTNLEAASIVAMIAAGETNREIARVHGITHSMVSRIRLGKSWPEMTEGLRETNDNFRRYATLRL